jgi:segregation and condensation protein B
MKIILRKKMNLNNRTFPEYSRNEQKAIIESLVFASEDPLSLNNIFHLLITSSIRNEFETQNENEEQTDLSTEIENKYAELKDYIKELIDEINVDLRESERPYYIVEYAGGYQFSTRKEYGRFVFELLKNKTKKRLSQAALEALSIIAYKQPISKPEIEQIRGVNSNEIVNSLIDKGFIKISGRSKSLGKPLLYSTTQEFLRAFGINSLSELPKLREIDEIAKMEIEHDDNDNSLTIEVMDDDSAKSNENELLKMDVNKN